MAAPRRRLTYTCKALAPSSSGVVKPRSPAARPIPEWCLEYQRRIEAAQRDYLLLKEQEEPEEALEGQGEIQMSEENPDLVQTQLSELAQQIVHVIEACNEEKDILEADFDSVKNRITIMESQLQTEKIRIDSEVQGVGSMMNFQQAMLEELRAGIHVLRNQDEQIVEEATDLFAAIKAELDNQSKKVLDTGLQLFANKVAIQGVQKTIGVLSKRIDEVTTVLATVTESIKDIPSRREMRQYQETMDESVNRLAEANTRLTTAMEAYKFSESTPLGIPQSLAGPSGTQTFMHPQRAAAFYSPSVSSLRDTASEYSWQGRIRGGAGSGAGAAGDGAAGDGAAGNGAAGNGAAGDGAAGDGAAGNNAAGGGGPPPPPDPPPSDGGRRGRPSRRQRRIKDLESSKPIKIKEPKKFFGKPGEDFDTWWVLVQVYIKDQPERFPEDERTIDLIGSLMESYAASWHIQWLKGTLSGLHPKSMTGYINALKLRFEDRDAKDEAYAELEKVRYEGCIRDMFTKIQTLNDKAAVSGAAFKKLILERLPNKILEQMHTVDLTGRTDQEIMTIITNAGRTAKKWEAARNNLGLKKQFKGKDKALSRFRRDDISEAPKRERRKHKSDRSDRKKFKKQKRPERDNSKTAGIDSSELQRRKSAGECLRCAWPSDRKGTHRVADCVRPIKLNKGTAAFPKAKEYQKMKIAGMELLSDSEESSSEDSEDDSEEDSGSESNSDEDTPEDESEGEYLDNEEQEFQEEEEEGNWWDSPPEEEEEL
jgi:hypothetical protein